MTSPRPVCLITNAHTYVGPALARVLARSGHDFVLHVPAPGRNTLDAPDQVVEALVEELGALGSVATVVHDADLSTAEGNRACVETALSTYGRLDACCLVTGVITAGRFLQATPETWEQQKRFNLDMVFHGLQAVLPPLLEARSGQVVVFTSAAGARPEPKVSLYSATRAGANALVRAVGLEHADSGVAVNAVGTNFMNFPGFRDANGMSDPARAERVLAAVPMHRLGELDELAEFTAVLLDGRSRFQTGQFFSFSGGWSS